VVTKRSTTSTKKVKNLKPKNITPKQAKDVKGGESISFSRKIKPY
jgi:hypothetical protein